MESPLHSGVRKICGISIDSPMTDERACTEMKLFLTRIVDHTTIDISEEEDLAITLMIREQFKEDKDK